MLKCHLLSGVLLDTGASPLRLALERSDLSTSASPLCGLEEGHMEMNFVCGVEGSNPDSADKVEELILDVLENICSEGIDSESQSQRYISWSYRNERLGVTAGHTVSK